jgi:hypothetical protein
MDGDDAIHALADKVEANLLGGVWGAVTTVAIPASGVATTNVVTFPAGRFTQPPQVVGSPQVTGAAVNQFTVGVGVATVSSVSVTAARNVASAANLGVSIIAFQNL